MTAIPNVATTYAETLPAGEDLSGSQFRFVIRSADTYIAITANTQLPDGILQNAPALGEPCRVIAVGASKLEASAAILVGAFVGPSANGRGESRTKNQTNTNYICGRAYSAAANAGEIIPVVVNCVTPTQGL